MPPAKSVAATSILVNMCRWSAMKSRFLCQSRRSGNDGFWRRRAGPVAGAQISVKIEGSPPPVREHALAQLTPEEGLLSAAACTIPDSHLCSVFLPATHYL